MTTLPERRLETRITAPQEWLTKLAHLNVHRAAGPAPHKPILLWVILDLAESGLLPPDRLPLTPELKRRFRRYWMIVAHRRTQQPDVRYPFHHLQGGGFWTALSEHGTNSSQCRQTVHALLDPSFATLAGDPAWRAAARRVLVETYFDPGERAALYALLGAPALSDAQNGNDGSLNAPGGAANTRASVRGGARRKVTMNSGEHHAGFYTPDVKEQGLAVCHVLAQAGGQLTSARLAEVLGDFLQIPEGIRNRPHGRHPSHTLWSYHLAWVCTGLRKQGFMARNRPETRGMCLLTGHGHELGRWAAQIYEGDSTGAPDWVTTFLQPVLSRMSDLLKGTEHCKPPDYELCRWVRYCYLLNRPELGIAVYNLILADNVSPALYKQTERQARILKLRLREQVSQELVHVDDNRP
jgi:hypothetical protein